MRQHQYSNCNCFLCFLLQVLFSEARVLGLGPRFMSIYIQKFAVSSVGTESSAFLICFFCFLLSLGIHGCNDMLDFRLKGEYITTRLTG